MPDEENGKKYVNWKLVCLKYVVGPVLAATVPSIISLYAVHIANSAQLEIIRLQTKLEAAEKELEDTKKEQEEAIEKAKEEAKKSAEEEILLSNEARWVGMAALIRKEMEESGMAMPLPELPTKMDKPDPETTKYLDAAWREAEKVRMKKEGKRPRPIPRRYMQQTATEWDWSKKAGVR